jgi:hypothetical protein
LPRDIADIRHVPSRTRAVRSSLLCLAILLALPCAAQAEQSALASADPSKHAAPGLDLSFDPAVAAERVGGPLVQPVEPGPRDSAADAPFSLGVDIKTKTRRDVRSPATWTSAREEAPTLADKVEGIVERSTIGVTGTYRF